jgi:predicted metal-dependent phosphoesterase TrpH
MFGNIKYQFYVDKLNFYYIMVLSGYYFKLSKELYSMTCDLHVHSNCSDGTLTPAELVSLAENLNVSAVALCDHNTVNGLSNFQKAAKNSSVTAVNGIEISTEYNGTELHILGLFQPESKFEEIAAMMSRIKIFKEESNVKLVNNLRADGYLVDYEEIRNKNNGAYINRAHIAAELIEKGYFTDRKEIFNTILSPDGGYYTPPERFKALEMIGYLDSIGATPVWAHPFLDMNAKEIDAFLPVAKFHGLIGMETRYSLYDEETQKTAKMLAEKHGIKQSGGSDFHGTNKPDISLGSGKGNLEVPFEFYENLKK